MAFLFGDALRANRTHSRVQGMQTQSCELLILQNKFKREYGFEKLLRRFRVGSLAGRSKFPYGFPRPLLCPKASARYTRLPLLATWDITSIKTTFSCFYLVLRTKPRSAYPSTFVFAARDIISTNYTCRTVCTYHLLASQYTANGGMHQTKHIRTISYHEIGSDLFFISILSLTAHKKREAMLILASPRFSI